MASIKYKITILANSSTWYLLSISTLFFLSRKKNKKIKRVKQEIRPSVLSNLSHRYRTIRHTKVRRNGLLTADGTGRLGLGTGQPREDAHFENTGDLLDGLGEGLDFPDACFAAAVFPGFDVGPCQQRREGRVDDEEALVRLEGTLLGSSVEPDGWVDAT
jgi:hypothetical protein